MYTRAQMTNKNYYLLKGNYFVVLKHSADDDVVCTGRVGEINRGGSTLGPGGAHTPQMLASPPNILVPTAKIRIVKI